MSDRPTALKSAGVYTDANDIDVSHASIDSSLAKVWSDDRVGEIAVSVDRILFDNLIDIAIRYLEPHGFSQNIENLLSIIDSMRIGVFAATTSKTASDKRSIAKRVMPNLFMRLPNKQKNGPLLTKFYEEIAHYESEITRLQEFENKSKRVLNAAIQDESGRKAANMLQRENNALREELAKLAKKLSITESALQSAPNTDLSETLPIGVRSCVVRAIRENEGTILLKHEGGQFSVPLRFVGGTPEVHARGLTHFEGGVLKSVWIFDPAPKPFEKKIATILSVDGRRVKLRFPDRTETIIQNANDHTPLQPGHQLMTLFSGRKIVGLDPVTPGAQGQSSALIYEEQTSMQLKNLNVESDG